MRAGRCSGLLNLEGIRMKIREALDRLRACHAEAGDYAAIDPAKTCDGIKFGDPDRELTGIAVTCAPTYEVIKQAAALSCNLIICHEPTFYSHADTTDWMEDNPVYQVKARQLSEQGIVVYRDHDALHAHNPDGIYTGVMKELGWEPYRADTGRRPMLYELPPRPVSQLADELKDALGMRTVRLIGCTGGVVSKVAYIGGGNLSLDDTNTKRMMGETEVMIAGELIDWTVMSFVHDAATMGQQKTIIQLGHFNSEALGMKYTAKRLEKLLGGEAPVHWIPTGDPYRYL